MRAILAVDAENKVTGITVQPVSRADLLAWQNYVVHNPASRPMHHAGWFGVLEDAFSVKTHFLIARSEGAVCGVLPLYHSRSRFTGSHVASLDDGFLADYDDVASALLASAIEVRRETRSRYLLLRTGEEVRTPHIPVRTRRTVRRLINTGMGEEALFASLSSYVRRDVRRAEKRGYDVSLDHALTHIDGAFYDQYAKQMHLLGTPVMPRAMMTAMKKHLGMERLRLHLLQQSGRIVGGLLTVTATQRWTALYAAVEESSSNDYANHLLYWHAIREACRSSVPCMDLGRNTPGSGPQRFKAKWTGEDQYADHLYFGEADAAQATDDLYGGKTLKQRLWSRLPLPLANVLGPAMRRSLPFG